MTNNFSERLDEVKKNLNQNYQLFEADYNGFNKLFDSIKEAFPAIGNKELQTLKNRLLGLKDIARIASIKGYSGSSPVMQVTNPVIGFILNVKDKTYGLKFKYNSYLTGMFD